MAEQWPSAGRVVHVKDPETGVCRGASIVRVEGDGAEAKVELFVYPSVTLPDIEVTPDNLWDEGTWHWPEYVGPAAERMGSGGTGRRPDQAALAPEHVHDDSGCGNFV